MVLVLDYVSSTLQQSQFSRVVRKTLFLHGFCLVAQMSMNTRMTFSLTQYSSDHVS